MDELASAFFSLSQQDNEDKIYELFAETSVYNSLFYYENEDAPSITPSRKEFIDSINELSRDRNPENVVSWKLSSKEPFGDEEIDMYNQVLHGDIHEMYELCYDVNFKNEDDVPVVLIVMRTDNGWYIFGVDA